MNSYPSELRTPPLPLISFIGCPELHKELGTYFSQTLRPPLVSIGIAEANEVLLSRLFGTIKPPKPFATPDGILKADWFIKQRQRRAAVALALINRCDVDGDPTSWMRMLSSLKSVREATSHKGAGLLVLVLQEAGPAAEIPPDRVAGICNNLDIPPRCLFPLSRDVFSSPDKLMSLHQALQPVGAAVMEAAAAYYAAAAQRQRTKQLDLSAALGSIPPEINVAVAFKLAVLAEFRQDWLTAVSCYQTAYAALRGVPLGLPQVSVQRHAEVVRVAELVHFKTMMLLLHQQRGGEALAQLREHLGLWGPVPAGFTPAAAASHYSWLGRQYLTAAEMVAGRLDEATLQANKDCGPGFLALAAAHLAVARKAAAEEARLQRGGAPPAFDLGSVKKGLYVGQFMHKLDTGALRDLSDAEYCAYLDAEEARCNHSQLVLEAAGPALNLFQGPQHERVRSQLLLIMSQQHIDTNNLLAARKLLLQVAYVYRRDGWNLLLLQVLLLLRDCSARLKLNKDAYICSLELSALLAALCKQQEQQQQQQQLATPPSQQQQQQLLDPQQALALATAAANSILAGGGDKKPGIMKPAAGTSPSGSPSPSGGSEGGPGSPHHKGVGPPPPAAAAPGVLEYQVTYLDLAGELAAQGAGGEVGTRALPADILLKHQQQDFGWWRCLSVACGFQDAPSDPLTLYFCVALYSHLPVPLPLQQVMLQQVDPQGHWEAAALPGMPPPPASSSSGGTGAAPHPHADTPDDDHNISSSSQTAGRQSPASSGDGPGADHPLQLLPGQWLLLHIPLPARCIGLLQVERLTLQLSNSCSVRYHLTSFPCSLSGVLGGGPYPKGVCPFPIAGRVRPGVCGAMVGHVGLLPKLQLLTAGLSLVGEFTPIEVQLTTHNPLVEGVLELSLRSATGAVPGQVTLLARLPDNKLHALSVDSHVLHLPSIPAATTHVVQLWLRSPVAATTVKLTAQLSCPAAVTSSVAVRFEEPFEAVTRVTGECHMHSLVTPSPAYEAAAAAVTPGQALPSGRGKALPLAIGQPVMAQVLVRGCQSPELELLDVKVDLPQESGVQVLNQLSSQLPQRPAPVAQGSILCFLLHLVPTAISSNNSSSSLGRLHLYWKRRHPITLGGSSSSSGGGPRGVLGAQDGISAAAAAAGGGGGGGDLSPPGEVVTAVELPVVLVQDSWIRVKLVCPSTVTAGLAFPLALQLHNTSGQLQEVVVVLQDTQGFIFSGDKAQQLVLQPRENSSVSWAMVAHVSGKLLLPTIQVTATRLNCTMITQSSYVHVMAF